nr:hypothetical protein CFP56_32465 [Quercus suber]
MWRKSFGVGALAANKPKPAISETAIVRGPSSGTTRARCGMEACISLTETSDCWYAAMPDQIQPSYLSEGCSLYSHVTSRAIEMRLNCVFWFQAARSEDARKQPCTCVYDCETFSSVSYSSVTSSLTDLAHSHHHAALQAHSRRGRAGSSLGAGDESGADSYSHQAAQHVGGCESYAIHIPLWEYHQNRRKLRHRGPRSGMSSASANGQAGPDWSQIPQICFFASRTDVGLLPLASTLLFWPTADGHSPEIFAEYTRRQYLAKAPARNPFGDEEEAIPFNDLDIYTRIRVLHQLSTWTLGNAERIRGLMPADEDHLNWRIEPLGWDKEDRAYFVLDDNRLYRRSDEEPPPPSPKSKPKATPKAKTKWAAKSRIRGTRSSRRRRVEETSEEEVDEPDDDVQAGVGEGEDTTMDNTEDKVEDEPGFGFTSKTWECVAVTLDEYQDFMSTIFRSRDPNEKQLRKNLEETVIPIIEKRDEAIKQKHFKKLREMENMQKMATAKRSSRLADKADKEKEEREQQEAEERKQRDLKMAHEEEERQKRIEEGHESRRLTREQRLKEREVKRILHEERLAQLDAQEARAISQDPNSENGETKRMSERQTKSQKEQHQKELAKLADEDGTWYFDCAVCGLHGENLDDGTHSLACDDCGVWQHSKCYGFSPKQAEKDNFSFVCKTCKRKQADANRPRTPKLKLNNKKSSESPETRHNNSSASDVDKSKENGLPDHVQKQLDGPQSASQPRPSPGPYGRLTNVPNLSPYGQIADKPGYPPVANFAPLPPQQPWQGHHYPPLQQQPSPSYANSLPASAMNGYGASHYQQHQYVHQQAVNASGARLASPKHQSSLQSGTTALPQNQSPKQHQHTPVHYPQHALPNRRLSDAPPNGLHTPSQSLRHPQPQTPQPSVLARSPKASFPPPAEPRNPEQSPVKSSPVQPQTSASAKGPALTLTPRPEVAGTPHTVSISINVSVNCAPCLPDTMTLKLLRSAFSSFLSDLIARTRRLKNKEDHGPWRAVERMTNRLPERIRGLPFSQRHHQKPSRLGLCRECAVYAFLSLFREQRGITGQTSYDELASCESTDIKSHNGCLGMKISRS